MLLLTGCGGGGSGESERTLRGTGYRFAAPAGWHIVRSGRQMRAADGISLVSVTRYELVHAYRPELWPRVVSELDRAAAELAVQQHGHVSHSSTTTLSGRRARRYDIAYTHDDKRLIERLAFVLRRKTEYLLLCRYEDGGDTRACDRLLATFTLLAA